MKQYRKYKFIKEALSDSMINQLQYIVNNPDKSTPNEVLIAKQKLKNIDIISNIDDETFWKDMIVIKRKKYFNMKYKINLFKRIVISAFTNISYEIGSNYLKQMINFCDMIYKEFANIGDIERGGDMEEFGSLIFVIDRKNKNKFENMLFPLAERYIEIDNNLIFKENKIGYRIIF